MSEGINFNDYLVRNEKYLKENGETDKVCNQEIDANEISIFFSESHFDADNDGVMSEDDFLDWYKRNQSAISGFLRDEYSQYNYDSDETKNAMKEAIVSFVEETGADIDVSGLTINDEGDGDNENETLNDEGLSDNTGGYICPPELEKYNTGLSNANNGNYDYNNYATMDYYVTDTLNNVLYNENISVEDKTKFMENARSSYPNLTNYINDFFDTCGEEYYIDQLENMANDENCSMEDIVNFKNCYYRMQGDNEFQNDNFEKLLTSQVDILRKKVKSEEDLIYFNKNFKSIDDILNQVQNEKIVSDHKVKEQLLSNCNSVLAMYGGGEYNGVATQGAVQELQNALNASTWEERTEFENIFGYTSAYDADTQLEIMSTYNEQTGSNLFKDWASHTNNGNYSTASLRDEDFYNLAEPLFDNLIQKAKSGDEEMAKCIVDTIVSLEELGVKSYQLNFVNRLLNENNFDRNFINQLNKIYNDNYTGDTFKELLTAHFSPEQKKDFDNKNIL